MYFGTSRDAIAFWIFIRLFIWFERLEGHWCNTWHNSHKTLLSIRVIILLARSNYNPYYKCSIFGNAENKIFAFIFSKTFLLIYYNNNEIACHIATRLILRFTCSVVIYNRWDEQICEWRTDLESLIFGSRLWIIPEVERSTMWIKAISLAELKMWVIESCARKVARDFNLSYWFMHVS